MAIQTVEDFGNVNLDLNATIGSGSIDTSWLHWPSISLPQPGIFTWLIVAGGLFGLAVFKGPQHGLIWANPPPYFGGAVNRDFFPTKVTRPWRNPQTGKQEEIEVVGKDGKSHKEIRQETYWETRGRFVRSVINYPGYWADENDWICRVGFRYDFTTGQEVAINQQGETDPSAVGSASRVIKFPGNAINRFLADKFAYHYLGNYWFLERAAMHDWRWWERKDGPAFERRKRERYIPLTVRPSAVDFGDKKPLLDKTGLPWGVKITVRSKVRNIRIAWIEVPDSGDQMIEIIRGMVNEQWQKLKIIDYPGLDESATPTPEQLRANVENIVEEDDVRLGKLLLDYLKDTAAGNAWLRIMNQLGREVVEIVVEEKMLMGDYADLITEIRKEQIRKRALEIKGAGIKNFKKEVAEGMRAEITAVKEGGAAGIAMALSGAYSPEGRPPPTSVDNLIAANLFPGLKDGMKDDGGSAAQPSQEESSPPPRQDQGGRGDRRGGRRGRNRR